MSKARRGDGWTSRDKVQHAVFSLLATVSAQYLLVNKLGWKESASLPASAAVVGAGGVGKELYDWRATPSRHFCGKDLVANSVGIAVALAVMVI